MDSLQHTVKATNDPKKIVKYISGYFDKVVPKKIEKNLLKNHQSLKNATLRVNAKTLPKMVKNGPADILNLGTLGIFLTIHIAK